MGRKSFIEEICEIPKLIQAEGKLVAYLAIDHEVSVFFLGSTSRYTCVSLL